MEQFSERKELLEEYYANIENCVNEIESCDIAISALEEIQQYREIGTVEECREAIECQPEVNNWIPCSERLPEESINQITNDYQEYNVTFSNFEVTDTRHYKFGKGHWWNSGQCMDNYVIAWQPLPEPYREVEHE